MKFTSVRRLEPVVAALVFLLGVALIVLRGLDSIEGLIGPLGPWFLQLQVLMYLA